MSYESPPTFSSGVLRIACVSDTHNEDPSAQIPDADILIVAGDMTDKGTMPELEAAFTWISSLLHRVKIVVAGARPRESNQDCDWMQSNGEAGNHDLGLDPNHDQFRPEALEMFTSEAARAAGIQYLHCEAKTVAYYISQSSAIRPIKVYGNPAQPDFLNMRYAFTYAPYPSEASLAAWAGAPAKEEGVHIWAMHSPPKDRLDAINVGGGLIGCEAQGRSIAASRPLLCVFGHYHFSWGLERVQWEDEDDDIAKADILTLSKERKGEQRLNGPETRAEFDFQGNTGSADVLPALEVGKETVFVNAAWMTMKKRAIPDRNLPLVVTLQLP